jgi:hypothetical protein
MTWRDKLEIGLKEDAPFRRDNLPAHQVRGPEKSAGPGRSPELPGARDERNEPATQPGVRQPMGRIRPTTGRSKRVR